MHVVDITHDNVCSSMLSCFFSYVELLLTGRPISSFGFAQVCSPAIFETCFSYDKDIWITATDYYNVLLHNCAFLPHSP